MRNTALIVAGLLLAANPAFAIGPGGFAHGFASVVQGGGSAQAMPEASSLFPQRYCAAFGSCIDGRSIAIRAAWNAETDAVLPLDRLALTSTDVERAFAAVRIETNPFLFIPSAPAAEESVDYGVLTGSVPAEQPL